MRAVILERQGQPLWLTLLIYLMVIVTVISGLDYFFGLRRHVNAARDAVETASSQRVAARS